MQPEVRNPRWRLTCRHTYISACTQRSCMIQTTISMFSRSSNSTKLFPILCDASGSQKSKMADPQTGNTYISACTQRSCMIQTAISMFSRSRNSKKLFFILSDASGIQKSKMADPETGNTHISACTQRICKIPTATPMLSSSGKSTKPFSILCDVSGS